MHVLQQPSTWMMLAGGVILLIGAAMQCSTQRNTTRMEPWKKEVLTVRSYRSRYPFGIGAIILVSGVLLLTNMSPSIVSILAGLAFVIWGVSIQNGRRLRREPLRGKAGYILTTFGIVIIVFGAGLFVLTQFA